MSLINVVRVDRRTLFFVIRGAPRFSYWGPLSESKQAHVCNEISAESPYESATSDFSGGPRDMPVAARNRGDWVCCLGERTPTSAEPLQVNAAGGAQRPAPADAIFNSTSGKVVIGRRAAGGTDNAGIIPPP